MTDRHLSKEEREALKGYIDLASKYLNNDYKMETGKGKITELDLSHFYRCLDRAFEDLSLKEAESFHKSKPV